MFGRIINELEEGIISLLLASMTVLVFVEVVLRFGFNTGFMWTQELTLHISAWMVLFGASYGIKVGSHIGVDALVRAMPSWLRRIVTGIACLLALVYCGLFLYGSWAYLDKMHMIGIEMEDLPVPKSIAHSILIIGFSLISLRLLQLLWQLFRGGADSFKLADEAKESVRLIQQAKEERDEWLDRETADHDESGDKSAVIYKTTGDGSDNKGGERT